MITKDNPDLAYTILGFVVDLFIMLIPIIIISGIVSIILKNIFEMDSDETQKVFGWIGIVLLVISLVLYFS